MLDGTGAAPTGLADDLTFGAAGGGLGGGGLYGVFGVTMVDAGRVEDIMPLIDVNVGCSTSDTD